MVESVGGLRAIMKRYLITGATSGLGAAVGVSIEERGDRALALTRFKVNFSDGAAVTDAVKAYSIGEAGDARPFDGIFHAAGSELVAPLRLTSDEQYRTAMMAADSAFAILRAAASKGVMADGGSIVLMSSVAAHRGTAGMAAYSASKAAIEGMARAAAVELAARRIRINCVAAGAFRSPMHDRITKRLPQAGQDAYAAAHPLGIGEVEAVRDAVLHLLGDAARWTTGTTVVVDGGYLAV
jgi:NAD(P)-dependent dehydrogenase (short-subunit alcohol dehydrogenase family)